MIAGWMLAELGADVVAVEPVGGSPARRCGPYADDLRDREHALPWWAYARNKRSVVVDLGNEKGRVTLLDLARRADILIESEMPGVMPKLGLGYEDLAEVNPGLIYVSISPFGQTGPKAQWNASDLTVLAAGGPLWLTGDHDRPPVRVSVPQAFAHAGAEAASVALVALQERHRSGRGQHLDVSAQQAVTLATQSDIISAAVGDDQACRYGGGVVTGPIIVRFVYPAADGHVSITHVFGAAIGLATARLMQRVHADGFCDEVIRDKDWVGFGALLLKGTETVETLQQAKDVVAAWTASKTKAQLLEDAMTHGLLIAPCSSLRDVLASSQLDARGFFVETPRPDGNGSVRMPGAFSRFSRNDAIPPKPAPRCGEHTVEVLREWQALEPRSFEGGGDGTARPLEGMKVLDFMWAIAGPMATRMLADYGATVIRIESINFIDACRTMRPFVGGRPDSDQSGLFHACNASKHMLTIDLSKPESRGVIEDLISWADIVCESFAPGKFESMGWGYSALCKIKPDIIQLSTSLMGQTGPLARYAGYGNLAAAIAGFFELTGWPDRPPAGPFGAYTDYAAPKFCASALLAAVEHRRRTGEGQHVDVSQAESAMHFIAPAILDVEVNGGCPTRAGNHDPVFAPHGCYLCSGDEAWIALAIEEDTKWLALCSVLDAAALADDPRFASSRARLDHRDALDEEISQRTRRWEVGELEAVLQDHGIAAHQVLDSTGLCKDPQLVAREHFLARGDGDAIVEATRTKLSRTPARVRDGLALLGRDNHEVLNGLLGYDDERITELAIAGVLE